jgi:hypothetical protein
MPELADIVRSQLPVDVVMGVVKFVVKFVGQGPGQREARSDCRCGAAPVCAAPSAAAAETRRFLMHQKQAPPSC